MPKRANENAAYVQLKTQYIDTQGDGRDVIYTLYLGANHTDNFAIERNHQYKNNIVIKGITQFDSDSGKFNTYDARVDMSANTSSYYISMLNEHALDAHFCVLPMDVYFFNTDENTQLKIELDGNPEWIAMERIPADCMENGNLPTTTIEKDNPLLSTGVWHAGHGKRSYFTPTLVNALRNANQGEVTIENSRDRIYFYVDENLSATQDRTVTIGLTYSDSKGTSKREELSITQTHFRPVEYYDEDYKENRTIYMEQYEEYLDHYDPLDEFATEQRYEGLPWGVYGITISNFTAWSGWKRINVEAENNYYRGLEFTNKIISESGGSHMNLNDIPQSAAEYCYNRNKRDSEGIVSSNNQKWFLPGIRQMEYALTKYYNDFPEFQNYFYWSSSAAKKEDGLGSLKIPTAPVPPKPLKKVLMSMTMETRKINQKIYGLTLPQAIGTTCLRVMMEREAMRHGVNPSASARSV